MEKIQALQKELNSFQNQIEKCEKGSELSNDPKIPQKIAELKKSNNFDHISNYFNELAYQGNKEMISIACNEGLWKKTFQRSDIDEVENVLHVAWDKGNLQLVKYMIECGCDKEVRGTMNGDTPLIRAARNGHLEIVKYLVSVGANIETMNNEGNTPLAVA